MHIPAHDGRAAGTPARPSHVLQLDADVVDLAERQSEGAQPCVESYYGQVQVVRARLNRQIVSQAVVSGFTPFTEVFGAALVVERTARGLGAGFGVAFAAGFVAAGFAAGLASTTF